MMVNQGDGVFFEFFFKFIALCTLVKNMFMRFSCVAVGAVVVVIGVLFQVVVWKGFIPFRSSNCWFGGERGE